MTKFSFTIKEAAEVVGVSVSTMRKIIQREDFPVVRVSPRRLVVPADALRDWLNAGRRI